MRQTGLYFALGLLSTAMLSSAIAVYLLHDVDADQASHLDRAFQGLVFEGVVFSAIILCETGLLTSIGRLLLPIKGVAPRAKLGLTLGASVVLLQYPWDLAVRKVFRGASDRALSAYLVTAIVFSTVVLLRDCLKQVRQTSREG